MNDYSKIKGQLINQEQSLRKRLDDHLESEKMESLSASTGELSQYDNHPADTATDLYEREKDMALHAQLRHEYEEVQHALEKLQTGSYGVCEKTGEQIPLDRLEANPLARTLRTETNDTKPEYRPVEEEVLGGFGAHNYDGDDRETEFDGEDAYQSVARFNEQDVTYEDNVSEEDESRGSVEQYEDFLSTDMNGYQGEGSISIQHNHSYEKYTEEIDDQE